MIELVIVLALLIVFGYVIGHFFAKAKTEELFHDKMAKMTKIINEKNQMIIKIKGDLRVLQRRYESSQSAKEDLEYEILKKEEELSKVRESYNELESLIKEIQKDFHMIKHDKELLLKELEEKKQLLHNQDNIIILLEKKIKELTHTA
jgi:septal ring factor EnvC (AmiA/AmiB activator)